MIAAILDERDVLRGRADELPADLALRVRVVCGQDHHDRADRRDVARVRDRAADIARRAEVHIDLDDDRRRSTPAPAWPWPFPTVSRCDAGSRASSRCEPAQVPGCRRPTMLANERFIVAADLDGNRSSARVRIGAGIEAGRVDRRTR